MITTQKINNSKLGWGVRASFKIGLHKKDIALLEQIKSFFGVGNIYTSGLNATYEVNSLKEIKVILAHFTKYPLITQKYSDFILFKLAISLINNEEHLTDKGLREILNIKASMNKGISDKLKESYPNVVPVARPELKDNNIKDPYWLAGFTSGEGCFMVRIRKNSANESIPRVELVFQVTQHSRDTYLLYSLINYLGCGRYRERKGGLAGDFLVYKFSDLNLKIRPFFETYPLLGVKSREFKDFCLVLDIMKESAHLTQQGINQIIVIQSKMNTKRLD
jgi:LAGLIDADG endonuclease